MTCVQRLDQRPDPAAGRHIGVRITWRLLLRAAPRVLLLCANATQPWALRQRLDGKGMSHARGH